MAYATITELKASINKTTNTEDAVLTALLSAAENTINDFCNRPDGFVADAVATARVYAGMGDAYLFIDECTSISGVAVKDSPDDTTYTAWAATDWLAFSGDPHHPNFNRLPITGIMTAGGGDYATFLSGHYSGLPSFPPLETYTRAVPTVQVTAKWGYAVTVPPEIKQACIMQAARWYKAEQSAMTDTLANPEMGELIYRRELDPHIAMILVNGRYVKSSAGVA